MNEQTNGVSGFLLARIAEDEAAINSEAFLSPLGFGGLAPNRRQLAECEAKRRIVVRHASTPVLDHHAFGCTCGFRDHRLSECMACGNHTYDDGEFERRYGPCPDLCLMALPYADHPDYRQEWKNERASERAGRELSSSRRERVAE